MKKSLEVKTGKSIQDLYSQNLERFLQSIIPLFRARHGAESPLWKKDQNTVQILSNFITACQFPNFSPLVHLLIPPISTLLEDYEIENKQIGLLLLKHTFIENIPLADVRKCGIVPSFVTSIQIQLTFHDSPALIAAACDILPLLIPISHIPSSKPYLALSEQIMQSLIHGLVMSRGGSHVNQACFLRSAEKIADVMGLLTVKYLQILMSHACVVIAEGGDYKVIEAAVELILALIRNAWPRIAGCAGMVLRDVGKCWRRVKKGLGAEVMYQRVTSEEAGVLKGKFGEVIGRLEFYCGEECVEEFEAMRGICGGEFMELFSSDETEIVGR